MNKSGFIFTFLCLVLLALPCSAQHQEDNWFFGFGNEVQFEGGVPIVAPANDFYATEGSATISTPEGELQFYTDGIRIFDRFGALMSGNNVLHGSDSSTQNAIIIPFPGDSENRFYYVFTVPAQVNYYQNFSHSGLEYVIVDMAGNGGLGTVSQASQELLPMIEEKLHATWHSNQRDVWLVVHGAEDDAFYSFLINCDGIQDPVISNTGQGRTQGLDFGSARGTLKLSPNSERIAIAHTNLTDEGFLDEAVIEVGTFNATTGAIEIQDEKVIGPGFMHESYSCEFSPNSNVLYWGILGGGPVRQFDLLADDFAGSMLELGSQFGEYWASMTLGPDGKIYSARSNGNAYLAQIEFPDVVGPGCNIAIEGVPLVAFNSLGISNCWMYPFPEWVAPQDEEVSIELCEGEWVQLSVEELEGSYLWFSGSTAALEEVNQGGSYWVQIDDGCTQYTRTFNVEEHEKPVVEFELSQAYSCEGDTLIITVQTDALEWEWEDGSVDIERSYTTSIDTYVTTFVATCEWKDSLIIAFQNHGEHAIPSQFQVCEDTVFELELNEQEGTELLWSDGEMDWLFETTLEGLYWVELSNSCGVERLEFEVEQTFCNCEVFIPNAFTPDLNDLNEQFRPVSECPFVDYSFTIYNRWGEVVFSSNLPEAAWNGSVNGGSYYVKEGVYTYVLRYGLPNGDREEVYGSVVVLR